VDKIAFSVHVASDFNTRAPMNNWIGRVVQTVFSVRICCLLIKAFSNSWNLLRLSSSDSCAFEVSRAAKPRSGRDLTPKKWT
jgi:hypothetical protein